LENQAARGDSLALRQTVPDDEPFLAALYASTRTEELAITGWSDEQKAMFCRMQFGAQTVHYRKHYPDASVHVIERNGEPAGRLYVNRGATEIRIVDIALVSAHRGAGIGTYYLLELQEEARATGRVLSISVEKFNPALRLYQRLGFRPTEDQGVYLLMEWRAP
jgi:ribosomal protein S18 acetylase RimI-like enzyme